MMSVGVSSVQQWVFSTLRDYDEYTGEYQDACGVLVGTLGGECSVHQRDAMSTPGDVGTNEGKPRPTFEDLCSRAFCYFCFCSCICWPLEHQTAC